MYGNQHTGAFCLSVRWLFLGILLLFCFPFLQCSKPVTGGKSAQVESSVESTSSLEKTVEPFVQEQPQEFPTQTERDAAPEKISPENHFGGGESVESHENSESGLPEKTGAQETIVPESPGELMKETTPQDRGEAACRSHANCPDRSICVKGACQKVTCQKDGDCPEGSRCRDKLCEMRPPKGTCIVREDCPDPRHYCLTKKCEVYPCQRESDCPPKSYCANKICIKSSGSCKSSKDCTAFEFCNGGACLPQACQKDADCPAISRLCIKGLCMQKPQQGNCNQNSDCKKSEFCVKGTCKRIPCRSDSNCPTNGRCISGDCVQMPRCVAHKDCGAPTTFCVKSVCQSVSCTKDSDCPTGGNCQSRSCTTKPPAKTCTKDSDCSVPQFCRNSTCKNLTCQGASDCPKGSPCVRRVCQR